MTRCIRVRVVISWNRRIIKKKEEEERKKGKEKTEDGGKNERKKRKEGTREQEARVPVYTSKAHGLAACTASNIGQNFN